MFLTPEEKIVKLRKKYKITQKELSENGVTRSFLGMIEIGKKKLTENTAKILCKNFNEIFQKNKIDFFITPEQLLESPENQAVAFLEKVMLSSDIDKLNLFELELALNQLEVKKRIKYSIEFAEKFKFLKLLEKAIFFYKKSLVELKKEEDIKLILLEIMRINYYLNDFQDNVVIYEYFKDIISNNFTLQNEQIEYNYALSLLKINQYENSRYKLESLINNCNDKIIKFKSKNTLAYLVYENFGDYLKSVQLYFEILEDAVSRNNTIDLILIYSNLLNIELSEKNFGLIKLYLEKLEKILFENHSIIIETKVDILTLMGKAKEVLKDEINAKILYLNALEQNKLTNKPELRNEKLLFSLLKICTLEDIGIVKSIEATLLESETKHYDLLFLTFYFYDKFDLKKDKENLYSKIVDIF